MASEPSRDPALEWLDHVRPVGLVVAPAVLDELGLVPERQGKLDSEAFAEHVDPDADKPALADPWAFAEQVLGWEACHVAGAPGCPAVPDELSVRLPEHDTTLAPTWAVRELGDAGLSWQLLVRIEAPGVAPDARGALEGWEATPHQRFERLLRDTGVFAGLLVTDASLRLVYAPRGETSGWLEFPTRSLATVAGRAMLGGLKLLLGRFRLFVDADNHRLPSLLARSREAQAHVSTELSGQVLGALHELLRGLDAADPAVIRGLAAERPGHLYEGLLAVLMRLVFVLYAEDRDLLPSRSDARARELYETGYSLRGLYASLVEDAALNPDTMNERFGGWGRLLALFRLIHGGHPSGLVRARGGKLFDPAAYPLLEGRTDAGEPPRVLDVSDGCLLRILEGLMTLKRRGGERERLSYRSLDVEQIGSVYETVMGFTVETAAGPTLAIRAGKGNRLSTFVALDALLAAKPKDRARHLRESAGRAALTPAQARALQEADSLDGLVAALAGIVDERASPRHAVAKAGTPVLQPTDERRRTGSHYTPRSLTAPIVKHALEPAFERLGADATPDQVLDLKVCDPAMGSGAFLVEACRAIAERLVAAWARRPDLRPTIPPDEDEELHARRLVAQRCLYGVDRNPRAVDLARLSLWLATLASDHEFTFLDHALKCGDSLVGLSRVQISAMHWDTRKPPTFVGKLVRDHLRTAEAGRARIREQAEWASEAELRPLLRGVDHRLEVARVIGDGIVAAFFSAERQGARLARLVDFQKAVQSHLGSPRWAEAVAAWARNVGGSPCVTPFHWEIEFPEVFLREDAGFDAVVGNPPFAGKNTIIASNPKGYLPWLQTLHEGAHGNSDLVAHFYRRAFSLLRQHGAFGLIATNTIGQGDTRASGLEWILGHGGAILRATRRLKWPGEAAVVVSVVHLVKGAVSEPHLDGRQVPRISAYLVQGNLDTAPAPLTANAGKAFIGSYLLGMGFTFDDAAAAKGTASSLEEMRRLIEKDPRNAERIFPYIGGDEVNTNPRQAHHRYAIDFEDFPLRRDSTLKSWERMTAEERKLCLRSATVSEDYPEATAADWPDLLDIVDRFVKAERRTKADKQAKRYWWRFLRPRWELRAATALMTQVLATTRVSPHLIVARLPAGQIYSEQLVVLAYSTLAPFSVLQSRVHELWARFFSSTLEERLRYTPSDCFRTFPFPESFESHDRLETIGQAYHSSRAELMERRNEGLTKIYNRFHDQAEQAPDVAELRALHGAMDAAVLRAYGWHEFADRAALEFIEQETEGGAKVRTRLDWPASFKDELLARLLALNAERAEEERDAGLAPPVEDDQDGPDHNEAP